MRTSKCTRIEKRRETLPGRRCGARAGGRNWDVAALGMAWEVETPGPEIKSMARILVQALRRPSAETDSHSTSPDLVFAGQTR